jgi:hypothetical protein
MKQIKSLFVGICVSVVLLAAAQASFSQAVEPNYEIALQMILGSNDAAAKPDLPANLAQLSQNLTTRFGYSNYRLAGTMAGRLTSSGNYNYKSLSPLFSQTSDYRSQSFLEWGVQQLGTAAGTKGNQFTFRTFNFGARVPVVTGTVKDQAGKDQSVVNYEHIGVTSNKIAVPENAPTLVATINLPGGSDTIFLVMTVRPVEF